MIKIVFKLQKQLKRMNNKKQAFFCPFTLMCNTLKQNSFEKQQEIQSVQFTAHDAYSSFLRQRKPNLHELCRRFHASNKRGNSDTFKLLCCVTLQSPCFILEENTERLCILSKETHQMYVCLISIQTCSGKTFQRSTLSTFS